MSNLSEDEIFRMMIKWVEFKLDQIVEFAEKGHGFMGNDGYWGLSYDTDREEVEILHDLESRVTQGFFRIVSE